ASRVPKCHGAEAYLVTQAVQELGCQLRVRHSGQLGKEYPAPGQHQLEGDNVVVLRVLFVREAASIDIPAFLQPLPKLMAVLDNVGEMRRPDCAVRGCGNAEFLECC